MRASRSAIFAVFEAEAVEEAAGEAVRGAVAKEVQNMVPQTLSSTSSQPVLAMYLLVALACKALAFLEDGPGGSGC